MIKMFVEFMLLFLVFWIGYLMKWFMVEKNGSGKYNWLELLFIKVFRVGIEDDE